MSFWSTYFLIGAVTTAWSVFKIAYLKETLKFRTKLRSETKRLGKALAYSALGLAIAIRTAIWPLSYAATAAKIYRTGKRY